MAIRSRVAFVRASSPPHSSAFCASVCVRMSADVIMAAAACESALGDSAVPVTRDMAPAHATVPVAARVPLFDPVEVMRRGVVDAELQFVAQQLTERMHECAKRIVARPADVGTAEVGTADGAHGGGGGGGGGVGGAAASAGAAAAEAVSAVSAAAAAPGAGQISPEQQAIIDEFVERVQYRLGEATQGGGGAAVKSPVAVVTRLVSAWYQFESQDIELFAALMQPRYPRIAILTPEMSTSIASGRAYMEMPRDGIIGIVAFVNLTQMHNEDASEAVLAGRVEWLRTLQAEGNHWAILTAQITHAQHSFQFSCVDSLGSSELTSVRISRGRPTEAYQAHIFACLKIIGMEMCRYAAEAGYEYDMYKDMVHSVSTYLPGEGRVSGIQALMTGLPLFRDMPVHPAVRVVQRDGVSCGVYAVAAAVFSCEWLVRDRAGNYEIGAAINTDGFDTVALAIRARLAASFVLREMALPPTAVPPPVHITEAGRDYMARECAARATQPAADGENIVNVGHPFTSEHCRLGAAFLVNPTPS